MRSIVRIKMKILIGSLILVGACTLGWIFYPKSTKIFTITDFSAPTEAGVRAPVRPFGSGAMYVMYEGNIDSESKIEVVSNRGRDTHSIDLNPGYVHGVYGGAEEWVDDLSVRFISDSKASGDVKIGLYCGTAFSEDDRSWYLQLARR